MPDVEEVVNGLEMSYKYSNVDKNNTLVPQWIVLHAIALLKAQEPIEARLNLCESCAKEYPECDATIDGMEFGCGVGNDNIIGCTAYVNRWKIQEPVEPIENAGFYYCGACKYAFTSARQKYCSDCGRAVKWE